MYSTKQNLYLVHHKLKTKYGWHFTAAPQTITIWFVLIPPALSLISLQLNQYIQLSTITHCSDYLQPAMLRVYLGPDLSDFDDVKALERGSRRSDLRRRRGHNMNGVVTNSW